MQPILLDRFRAILIEQGAAAARTEGTSLCRGARDELFYVPFEHVNTAATLELVGITPGPKQIDEAYTVAQSRLRGGLSDDMVLRKAKEAGAFSFPAMRPNLVRMLDVLGFPAILGVPSSAALWGKAANKLHATSVVLMPPFAEASHSPAVSPTCLAARYCVGRSRRTSFPRWHRFQVPRCLWRWAPPRSMPSIGA